MSTQYTTPVGRLVDGDLFTIREEKDEAGKPKLTKNGQVKKTCWFKLAVDKANPEWPVFYQLLVETARAAYPSAFNPATGQLLPGAYTLKVQDGDGYSSKGKPLFDKPGHKGCWLVNFSTQYTPKVYPHGRYNAADMLVFDPAKPHAFPVELGDYIRVAGIASHNTSTQSPGLYLNPSLVEFMGHGERIVKQTGPDAAEVFANKAPAYIPPGMSATPLPMAAAPAPAPAATPPVPATAPTPAAVPVQPYGGYMAAPAAPAATPAPPVPPVPAGPVMTAAATTTYEAYRAAGWTDEQLIQHGYMQNPAVAAIGNDSIPY